MTFRTSRHRGVGEKKAKTKLFASMYLLFMTVCHSFENSVFSKSTGAEATGFGLKGIDLWMDWNYGRKIGLLEISHLQ